MGPRDKINIGKDTSYFESFEITSVDFLEDCDSLINIKFINNIYFINSGTEVIEYSFNGTTLHGDLIPGTNTAFLSFPNRYSNKIWFRAPDGASSVKVGAYVSNNHISSSQPISQVFSSDIALRFAEISEDGYSLTLTYNTALDEASVPLAGDFSLNGTSASPDSVDVSGFTVIITLDSQVLYNETVTLDYTAGGSPIQDEAGNDAENLVGEPVDNESEIGELPTLVSATIPTNGLSITLTYDELLNSSSTPSAGSFSLSGTSATPSSINVSSNTVVVNLNSAIQYNETVTISYTAGANPIEDLFGNNAANLTNQATTNNSQIGELPTLVTAAIPINGMTVVLTYDESLNTSSTPAAGDFTLAGTSAEPDSVLISGSTVTITLDSAVQYDDTVTIDYTAGVNPIEDLFGNNAANLNDQAVTNNSEVGELPALVSAVIPSNGLSVVLTYDESLNTSSTPATTDFLLTGTAVSINSVNVSGTTVTIGVASPIAQGASVTISYTAASNPIEDLFGNNAANLTNQAVTNNSTVDLTAPVIQTIVIPTEGLSVILTYNENLNESSVPSIGAFSLSGTVGVMSSVSIDDAVVTITLSAPAESGETITLSYTAGVNPIEDLAGNNAANLSNQAVTNNSVVGGGDVVAPVVQTIVIPSNGLTVVLTYDENLNESSTPSAGAFSLSGTTAIVASVGVLGTAVTLTLTGLVVSGETVTVSYTAGGSPIEDIAGNDAANLSSQAVTNNSTCVLEFAFDTFLSSETHTDHLVRQSIIFDGFGAGGGGARPTGDVGQSASGGGGEHSRVTKTTAEASYTISIGAGGNNGTDAGAQDGGDTTVSDSGGVILRAKGGLKGVAANPTGTAGAGGTGGVGDSLHAGGNGVIGSAGTNGAGGGSGGSSTAASGSAPGDYDGTAGNNTNNNANRGAGGARRSNSPARAGGSGWVTSYYVRSANLGYPYIVPNGVSHFRDPSNATSRDLTVPGTHVSGDCLLVLASIDGAGGASSMSGLTEMVDAADSGGGSTLGVWALDATGSDTLTLATAAEQTNSLVLRIRNAKPVLNWDLTGVQINAEQLDPPSHTHAAGSKPILWVAVAAYDANLPEVFSGFPTGFDRKLILNPRTYGNTSPGLVVAFRLETAATVNPESWTSNNQTGYAATIAIPLINS